MQPYLLGYNPHEDPYATWKNQPEPSEMKKEIDRLRGVQPWGPISHVYPLLRGAWYLGATLDRGILMNREAANELLSEEARRLGVSQPDGHLAYPASKGMDIALFDSQALRKKWYEVNGLKGETADMEDLRLERSVNLNWPIYFEPCDSLRYFAPTHGLTPNPRFAAQKARLERADQLRAIGHQDVVEIMYGHQDLMLNEEYQKEKMIILESFDGRMYALPERDYRPDEGYQLITDYPNLIPVNKLDQYDPIERSHHWALSALTGILGDLSGSQKNQEKHSQLHYTSDQLYEQFYQFGMNTGFKTHCRANQRLAEEGMEPDMPEIPDTDLRSAATVVEMTETVRSIMNFMLELAKGRGLITAESAAMAVHGFIAGIMTTPYPGHHNLLAAGKQELERQQAELEQLINQHQQAEPSEDGLTDTKTAQSNSNGQPAL
ncbi:MAG: hypothetical protein IBX50_11610 [Marinospirillum sp.]|uniref:hypothetical protein n=1 Tax=Marinospirillum sp. TaxID=2183934 RepID=UPI001A08457F|nr:hypothetical protein [Marinospirillum sp.]MBE0507344.1 hypothetical protein [Marinospirillum sp.]